MNVMISILTRLSKEAKATGEGVTLTGQQVDNVIAKMQFAESTIQILQTQLESAKLQLRSSELQRDLLKMQMQREAA